MDKETSSKTGGLSPQYKTYERQKCFVAHSHGARWCDDVVSVCNQVLPEFGLEPWYAADHFDPTKPLRDKVVELIANTRYGIYDLSYWRKDDKSEWHMPRNVLIELGVAIAINRPTLLLRHNENRISGLQLPTCLESVSANILEFSGSVVLQRILKEHLSCWVHTPPEHDWWNRYCMFGNRICKYREAYPHGQQWGQETICCHISDGQDADRLDFRGVVEEVLGRFSDVTFGYLDVLSKADGYDFLLCTHCQTVRSTPFAIYRITPQTPAETFLAIGMSLALEAQFTHRIPKILLTTNKHDIPSLLSGYEVVEARNDQECKTYLRKFMPDVIREVHKTTWRPRPLPFIEVVPKHPERLVGQGQIAQSGPSEASAYNDKGNVLYASKNYEEALAAYEQAIQLVSNEGLYHYNKGLTLYSLTRYDEALIAYERAVQLAPDYALAYGGRGQIHFSRKEYELAINDFDRALKLDPNISWVKTQLEEASRLLKNSGPMPVEILGERYQLQNPIGRGGMATIYRGLDRRMDRIVAIKVLREAYSFDPKFVTRFQREARAASALQHPNIVQVHDYGQTDGNYFIVMELIEGTDLRRYLRSRGVLDLDRAVIIAHDIALGLGAAHRRGIVHRNVKPQDVLVGRDGSIKLTDFGIASVYKDINAERLTPTGEILGTPQYFAPEQAQGEIVTPAADVYALGIVMYEMLTGRPPFDGDTPIGVAMQHIQDKPTPPSHLNPHIPRALEEIIMCCLEKAPERRFPDGSALARALEMLGEAEVGEADEGSTRPQSSQLSAVPQQPELPNTNASSPSQKGASPAIGSPSNILEMPGPSLYRIATSPLDKAQALSSSTPPTENKAEKPVSLLQRIAGQFFPSRLEPVELARKLEQAMADNLLSTAEGRQVAPTNYDIYLSIRDYQRLSKAGRAILIKELQDHLVDFAHQQHYTLRSVPILRLHTESKLRPGEVTIVAELADHQHMSSNASAAGITETQEISPEQLAQLRQQPPESNDAGATHPAGTINQADAINRAPTNPSGSLIGTVMPPARLTIRLPQASQQVYHIVKPVINIGRQLENDILVEDKLVSRYHAQIKYQPNGEFIIFDLGSTNGISVNGTPNLRQHTLRNGDSFTIGNYDFHFERR